MTADLRTRLKALVEEWREARFLTYSDWAADQLAALLAESEPEPCAEWRHCEHDGEDGHIACDVLCTDCGMHRDVHPDCEAKAKLPLGHAFDDGGHEDCDYCWAHVSMYGLGDCGQPRSAHEVK